MDQQRWGRIKRIFSTAIALGPDGARAHIAQECGTDEELYDELRQLLDEHFLVTEGEQSTPTLSREELPLEISGFAAGRFRILAKVGGGGFGDVFRAADEARGGQELALKVLRSPDPLALQHFKREFRSLAGLTHPNIVVLHELIADHGRWMFTMEFVDGVNLLAFLRSIPSGDRQSILRACLMQLAEGLHALHEHGLLHRDLKPSNVLVTLAGRVVLLDFGLVQPFATGVQQTATIAGTPNYMSPEQALGSPLAEPSDWYPVGVMLYQALTGRVPFHFDSYEALRRKSFERAVAPREIDPSITPDWNDLCLRLLEPDPSQRAGYDDVVRLLQPPASMAVREPASTPLIGREEPLRWLSEAYTLAETRPVLVHVCGSSGIGKSAFLREWSRRIGSEEGALVFSGRCYEGESVPYQAVDDLVDDITQFLRRLPPGEVERFLPRNFAALIRMFPVLAAFRPGPPAAGAVPDSSELRARAFGALRELLGRLAEHRRIVLVIDDLQWGDADGCAAMCDLLSASDAPPVLVVVAYRSEDVDANPWFGSLRDLAVPPANRKPIFIYLDRLEDADAAEFARCLIATPGDASAVALIVAHSGGNPFLVREMVRWLSGHGGDSDLSLPFSFADVVRSRVNGLAAESRHVLELLAVAGQPTVLSTLQAAAGIRNATAARDDLIAARLVRLRTLVGRDEIEVYHDRIREAITAELDPATLTELHHEMASGLCKAAQADPERIAVHYEKAFEARLCTRYALEAARHAVQVLAFHKASFFFKMALATEILDTAERRTVCRECADALAHAGRGPEAAECYLSACSGGAGVDEQLECNLLAAEQLLFTGHIDRGLAIFEAILGQVGLALPKGSYRFLPGLLFRRLQLRLRGLRWRDTPADKIPRGALLRIDTCASVAIGLSMIDIARGAALQTTSLLLALRAGEPARIARALAMEAAYRSTSGVKAESRAAALLEVARDLAERTGDPRAIGLSAAMGAACAWTAGRWEECYRRAHATRAALANRPERVAWERDTAAIFEIDALRWMGRWSEMKGLLPGLLEDARLRGDLYVQAPLQIEGGSCAALADDDPELARSGLSILDRWSNRGFHIEHLMELHNQVEIALYLGNGAEAMALVRKRWSALRESRLLRVQPFRIQMASLRARAAVCAARDSRAASQRREWVGLAARDARSIRRQGAPWGLALAELIEGDIEALLGRIDRAIACFEHAQASADTAGMLLHSATARRCRGLLAGGGAGRALVVAADRDFAAEGIHNPPAMASLIAPCFPREFR